MTGEELKSLLNLVPLSIEGGFFAETYRAPDVFRAECLDARYGASRNACTAIYYLLEPGTFSEMHRVRSDEIFHFYYGDPGEMVQLWPDGAVRRVVIGTDFQSGMRPQVVVPRGVWQGTRLVEGGTVALLGCTVSPGFDYADYESGVRDELIQHWPDARGFIKALTRK